MSFQAMLGWGIGIWLAAGIEAAWGAGTPGPLLLLAIAAGFSSGSLAGAGVGIVVGLCSAALGGSLLPCVAAAVASGLAAGLAARCFSPRHLLIAMGVAGVLSLCLCLLLALGSGLAFPAIIKHALLVGGLNALWMFPIYGIVLVTYPIHASMSHGRN